MLKSLNNQLTTVMVTIVAVALVGLAGCSQIPTNSSEPEGPTLLKRSTSSYKPTGDSLYTEAIMSAENGGTLALWDVELYFPPDALDSDTLISITIPDAEVFANLLTWAANNPDKSRPIMLGFMNMIKAVCNEGDWYLIPSLRLTIVKIEKFAEFALSGSPFITSPVMLGLERPEGDGPGRAFVLINAVLVESKKPTGEKGDWEFDGSKVGQAVTQIFHQDSHAASRAWRSATDGPIFNCGENKIWPDELKVEDWTNESLWKKAYGGTSEGKTLKERFAKAYQDFQGWKLFLELRTLCHEGQVTVEDFVSPDSWEKLPSGYKGEMPPVTISRTWALFRHSTATTSKEL